MILRCDGKLDSGIMRVGYAWACLAEGMRLAQAKQFEQAADLMYQFVLGGYAQASPSVRSPVIVLRVLIVRLAAA